MMNRHKASWIAIVAAALCAVAMSAPAAISAPAADDHHDAAHGGDAHGKGGGTPNPLVVKTELVGFTIIVFVILMLILKKFAWGPIAAALDRREQGIASEIDEAKRSNIEAKQMLAEYESRLQHATVEVKEMIDQARRDADAQKTKILAEAQNAARAEKDRALREIEAAKNEALGQLAGKSVDTALALAGQIVQRQLSGEEHTKLIREALDMLPSKN